MNFLFFLQGIPETIGAIALSLAIARISLRWGPIALAGTLISIVGSIIRSLPIALGLHSIAMLLLTVFFITKSTHVSPAKSFISITASVAILIFLEMVIHLFIFTVIGLEPKNIPRDSLKWALIGLPQAFLLFLLALLVRRFNIPMSEGWRI